MLLLNAKTCLFRTNVLSKQQQLADLILRNMRFLCDRKMDSVAFDDGEAAAAAAVSHKLTET